MFDTVCFSYLERPEALILRNVSIELADKESEAAFGVSRSIASALLRAEVRLHLHQCARYYRVITTGAIGNRECGQV